MKRLYLVPILIIALFILGLLAHDSIYGAETLGTLASIRWHSMTLANIAVAGTDQISTAQVDSLATMNEQTVATDFALSAYMSCTDTQTVVCTQSEPSTERTHIFTMNSNYTPGGLLHVWKKPYQKDSYYSINIGPPPLTASVPVDGDPPAYAWTYGNLLFVEPAPTKPDQFLLAYRALPDKMLHEDSTTQLDPALRRMVVALTAADICKKLGRPNEEATLRAEYAAFKSERLVLPKAELEGGAD